MSKFFSTFVPDFENKMEKISKAQIKLVKSLQQKKYRDELGLFVAEGEKCIEELCRGFQPEMLIISSKSDTLPDAPTKLYTASPTEIEQMSGLRTPQGVLAVFKKKPIGDCSLVIGDLTLALDGIQDPGNLGTIIRTCDWFGVRDIFCSPDTADCYNPKVVQATMGALARVRIHYVNLVEWLSALSRQQSDLKIYGTLLDGRNMYEVLKPADAKSSAVIIMGNEGNGISEPVRRLITHPVLIPSYSPKGISGQDGINKEASEVIESLNVSIATAIILAEFRRP